MIDHGLKVREVSVNGRIYRPIGHEKPREMLMPAVLSASAQTIMDHYGLYRQLTQLMEECGELIAAASHFCRNPEDFKLQTDLKEEMADVIVVLDQILVRMEVSESELAFLEELKINRQLERIKNV